MAMVFFPLPQTAIRRHHDYVRGKWTVLSEETVAFKGSIQPNFGEYMHATEQAREDLGAVYVYSDTQLKVGKQGTDSSGDRVVFEGEEYEIIREDVYKSGVCSHFQYRAEVRRDVL